MADVILPHTVCAPYRAKRYKWPSIVSLTISVIFLLVITLRWRYRVSFWELSYVFVGVTAMAVGFSAQFVELCASAPEGHSATVITIYYLCQQLGFILTVTVTATLSRRLFENALLRDLGTNAEARKVGLCWDKAAVISVSDQSRSLRRC